MKTVPRLHVLMTLDAVGGVWQYATDLAAALAQQGHRVTLASIGPSPSAEQLARVAGLDGIQLVQTDLVLDWLADGPAQVRETATAFAKLAENEGADVFHSNSPALAGAAAFTCPVVAVAHGCLATWWQAAKREPLAPAYRWHRTAMRKGLCSAAAVVAPSASFASAVQGTYALPRRPFVVHNGRYPLARNAAATPIDAALTVGRLWDPVKNTTLLDEVAGRLQVPFLAAGASRGPHGEDVTVSHLQVLGYLSGDALGQLIAQRPVFVSAATFEPFGLAVLEAAQSGCPLVLSDIPTFRELWDGCALFADPADAGAFTDAIEQLMAEPRLAADLSVAAMERAARFTPAAAAQAMEQIYAGVCVAAEAAA